MKWIKEPNNESTVRSFCIFNICGNRKGPCKSLCYRFACVGKRFCIHTNGCSRYFGKD